MPRGSRRKAASFSFRSASCAEYARLQTSASCFFRAALLTTRFLAPLSRDTSGWPSGPVAGAAAAGAAATSGLIAASVLSASLISTNASFPPSARMTAGLSGPNPSRAS